METHSPINCWTCRHCILNIENNARDYVCQRHHKVISNNPFAVLKPTDCKDWEK